MCIRDSVNKGILINVMPGALMFIIVTMKLNDAASEAIPNICNPIIQKSMPCPGLYAIEVNGA